MQLKQFPYVAGEESQFEYDGERPEDFLSIIIDEISDRIVARTDGSNLAPELLDPAVFYHFITGIYGHYTLNGSPFIGNWRLLPAATRMAERLEADTLVQVLKKAEHDIQAWDPQLLDDYDSGAISDRHDLPASTCERLDETFDLQFRPAVENCRCAYIPHEGAAPIRDPLTALAAWVMHELPREPLHDHDAIWARYSETHQWARDHVEGYNQNWTESIVGQEVYSLLESLSLRFARVVARPPLDALGKLPVSPRVLEMTDETQLLELDFADAVLLAELDTLTEIARFERPKAHVREQFPASQTHLREEPRLAFDLQTCTTKIVSRLAWRAPVVKYQSGFS